MGFLTCRLKSLSILNSETLSPSVLVLKTSPKLLKNLLIRQKLQSPLEQAALAALQQSVPHLLCSVFVIFLAPQEVS